MTRPSPPDDLLRHARVAAGTTNVRQSVRDLSLHALESHLLTLEHVATVARTVGEGIESARAGQGPEPRHARGDAWAGLEEAIGAALLALECAARDLARAGPCHTRAELDALRGAAGALVAELAMRWQPGAPLPGAMAKRTAAIVANLAGAIPCAGAAQAGAETDLSLRAREHFLAVRGKRISGAR